MDFQEFLRKKKIDPIRFGAQNPKLFQRIAKEFEGGGEIIVEHGKKFFWNDLRIEFPLDSVQLQED